MNKKVLIQDICFSHGESSCHERKPKNFTWTRENFKQMYVFILIMFYQEW